MMPPEHDVPDCACPWCRGVGANVTADEGADVLSAAEREAGDAFWRAQEAGETKRDRGGYYADGWRDGYLAARAAADEEARGRLAAVEAEAAGLKFRVEVACLGYAHLTDDDVPGGISDLAAYQEGAADAASAIRGELLAAPVAAQPEGQS